MKTALLPPFLMLLVNLGCASISNTPTEQIISKFSKIPPELDPSDNLLIGVGIIKIPEEFLTLHAIKRSRVEPRTGPGVEFPISEKFLEMGQMIIQLDKLGIWRKIYSPALKETGWVHYKTLQPIKSKNRFISLKKEILPRVFSINNTFNLRSFKNNRLTKVTVPKGSPFYTLKRNRDKILVIIGETHSVAWLAKRDAI